MRPHGNEWGLMDDVLANPNTPKEALVEAADAYRGAKHIPHNLVRHPNMPKDVAEELALGDNPHGYDHKVVRAYMDRPDVTDEEASDRWFNDSKFVDQDHKDWPMKVLRHADIPPSADLVEQPEAFDNFAIHKPDPLALERVRGEIERRGSLKWADVKKEMPELENTAVKDAFAGRKEHTPETFEQALGKLPDRQWNVTHDEWGGAQRHNDSNQLVFQLNASKELHDRLEADPEVHATYQKIHEASRRSGHPTLPHTVGWARVDTSNPHHWHVDEIQSDLDADINAERLPDTANKAKVGQIKDHLKKISGHIKGWHEALLHHVIQTAKEQGVSSLSIHSGRSKADLNVGANAQVPAKYSEIYDKMTKRAGFKPAQAKDIQVPHGTFESAGKQFEMVPFHDLSQKVKLDHELRVLHLQNPVAKPPKTGDNGDHEEE